MDNESFWMLDVDDEVYDKPIHYNKTLSDMSSPESASTCYESSYEFGNEYVTKPRNHRYSPEYKAPSNPNMGVFVDEAPLGIGNTVNKGSRKSFGFGNVVNTANFGTAAKASNNAVNSKIANLDIVDWGNYQKYIIELNNDIEEFSKIIQTLGLFKYYIKNKKNTFNVVELNKRFNSICLSCSDKIKQIEDKLNKINYCNHYLMANDGSNLEYLRTRFRLQDAALKKLKILIDTFNTVVREYTHLSKKLLIMSDGTNNYSNIANNNTTDALSATSTLANNSANSTPANGPIYTSPASGNDVSDATTANTTTDTVAANMDKKALLKEMNDRTKDIQILEQNAKDLNELFAELNSIIKKRGDNISSLENQILLSSDQIGKGGDDILELLKNDRRLQALYGISVCIVFGVFFTLVPSNLKKLVFKRF